MRSGGDDRQALSLSLSRSRSLSRSLVLVRSFRLSRALALFLYTLSRCEAGTYAVPSSLRGLDDLPLVTPRFYLSTYHTVTAVAAAAATPYPLGSHFSCSKTPDTSSVIFIFSVTWSFCRVAWGEGGVGGRYISSLFKANVMGSVFVLSQPPKTKTRPTM